MLQRGLVPLVPAPARGLALLRFWERDYPTRGLALPRGLGRGDYPRRGREGVVPAPAGTNSPAGKFLKIGFRVDEAKSKVESVFLEFRIFLKGNFSCFCVRQNFDFFMWSAVEGEENLSSPSPGAGTTLPPPLPRGTI
mgnify:CR=1 FL=1